MIGNAPGQQVEPGVWELEQTQPLSTYFVTLVAGPYHLHPRRARRHPARPQRAGASIAARPRQGRRRAVHGDQAVLRRVPPAVRDPLPVRRLPPGVRARVQRRRDGEPRLRHLPRPARSSPAGSTRGVRIARATHPRARDGAPVVRQPRHPDVVGRPVAQRVVRRVHGQPGHRRRHRVRRRVGRQRLRAPPVGPGRRPAAEHPPGRRQRRGRRERGAAGLRRHLLRQGLRASSSQLNATLGDEVFFAGAIDHFEPAPLRQRHDARPLRELGAGRRRATCRASPTTGCAPPARTASSSTGRPASYAVRRPRTTRPTGRTASGPPWRRRRDLDATRSLDDRGPGDRRSTPATGRCCSTPTATPGRC